MLMIKSGVVYAIFVFLLFAYSVEAATVSTSSFNTTLTTVSIASAVNMYAYEVNLSIDSGTVSGVTHYSFFGGTTSSGSNQRNNYLYAYQSKLDSSQTGYTGSTNLFNITHSSGAGLTLKGHTLVLGNSTVEYGTYTASGVTTTTSSGGSSGSATTTPTAEIITPEELVLKERKDLLVSPEQFNIDLVRGDEAEREIVIDYNGFLPLKIKFKVEGDLSRAVEFEAEEITLYPGEKKIIKFGVLVNSKGFKIGKILFIDGNKIVKEIPVLVNARDGDFLFDVKLDIRPEDILKENKLIADIELLQVGPQLKIDAIVTYVIKDLQGNEYWRKSETVSVLGENKYSKEIDLPELAEGQYVLGIEVAYLGGFAVASTMFDTSLQRFPLVKEQGLIIIASAVVIIFGAIIGIWAIFRRRKIRYMHKR